MLREDGQVTHGRSSAPIWITFKLAICLGLLALVESIVFGALVNYGALRRCPRLRPPSSLDLLKLKEEVASVGLP